jgi:hypothetical protein
MDKTSVQPQLNPVSSKSNCLNLGRLRGAKFAMKDATDILTMHQFKSILGNAEFDCRLFLEANFDELSEEDLGRHLDEALRLALEGNLNNLNMG